MLYEKVSNLARFDTIGLQVGLKPAGSPAQVRVRPFACKSPPTNPCVGLTSVFGLGLDFFCIVFIRARVRALKFNEIKKNDKNTCKALNLGLHA